MIADKIVEYLSAEKRSLDLAVFEEVGKLVQGRFSKQFMEARGERAFALRASNVGRCLAELAFGLHGYEPDGKKPDATLGLTFFVGDIVEAALVLLARLAGVPLAEAGSGQEEQALNLVLGREPIRLYAHPDGMLEAGGRKLVVEIKSMSDYGFAGFRDGKDLREDPFMASYYTQVQVYVAATGADAALILGFAKGSSELAERELARDPAEIDRLRGRLARLAAVPREIAAIRALREYGPEKEGRKRGKLVRCGYCAHHNTCWGKENLEVVKETVFGRERENLYLRGAP